jgi:hypothetical protein
MLFFARDRAKAYFYKAQHVAQQIDTTIYMGGYTNAGADGTVFWGQTIPANRGTVIVVR